MNDLQVAARDGSIGRTVALLGRGSFDIDQGTPEHGLTPLMIAASNGHSSITRILLNKGADVSIASADGWTPLHWAAQFGHLEVMTALVEAGADLQATTADGSTPLHLAAFNGHLEVMTALVQAGADLQATTADGFTPLHLAAGQGHLEAVTALVEAGADLEATTAIGDTALHMAAGIGHLEAVTALVKAGADLQATNDYGWTPLHMAAEDGPFWVMKALCSVQAFDVDYRDKFGRTPLYCAIVFGSCSPRAVRLLVDAGADTMSAVRYTGDDGEVVSDETPLDATNRCLREKKVGGKEATEEQLHRLGGIRRLLLRVDAADAVSWLWHKEVPVIGRGSEGSRRGKVGSTPLSRMLPILRRRARSRGVLLRALSRYSSKSAGDDL